MKMADTERHDFMLPAPELESGVCIALSPASHSDGLCITVCEGETAASAWDYVAEAASGVYLSVRSALLRLCKLAKRCFRSINRFVRRSVFGGSRMRRLAMAGGLRL